MHLGIAPQYVTACQHKYVNCYAVVPQPKASLPIECSSEISVCPSSFISHAAWLLLSSDETFIQSECQHMLTGCLCYLQCCCTQAALAELKHINHSRCLQLNYKRHTIYLLPYYGQGFYNTHISGAVLARSSL